MLAAYCASLCPCVVKAGSGSTCVGLVNITGRTRSCMGVGVRWHTATGCFVGIGCLEVAAQPAAGCTPFLCQ